MVNKAVICEDLRSNPTQSGFTICSDGKGYCCADSEEELNAAVKRLNRYMTEVSKTGTKVLHSEVPRHGCANLLVSVRVMEGKMPKEKFFLDLNSGRMEWMYFNPDSVAGGQYVVNVIYPELLKKAYRECRKGRVSDVFHYLEENCSQHLIDINSGEFKQYDEQFNGNPTAIGCTQSTFQKLVQLLQAKSLINQFCRTEYECISNFENLRRIGLAYTTTEDRRHSIRAYANLEDCQIETWLDGNMIVCHRYDSLRTMIDQGLKNLNFDDLVEIPSRIRREKTGLSDKGDDRS